MTIAVGQQELPIPLALKAASVVAKCADSTVRVLIDKMSYELGQQVPVLFDKSTVDTRTVTVEFIGGKTIKRRVKSGTMEVVTCDE
jgi:hypothetical protein